MKVICINKNFDDDILDGCFLTLGKTYNVLEKNITYPDVLGSFYGVEDDDSYGYYFKDRFITLKEYRKIKLKKLEKI